MLITRRKFFKTSAAGSATLLIPWPSLAQSESDGEAELEVRDVFEYDGGQISVQPIQHASFILHTPKGVIYSDPVGEAALYSEAGAPDLITITHEHGDHYEPDTLKAISTENTTIITNPAVAEMMPEDVPRKELIVLANGEETDFEGINISAIPAFNTTDERKEFHPEGRDNGYVLDFDGFRVYISGDTEDITQMRALKDIDLAFICMNLPFTMTAEQAASAVIEFKPKYVYPYHYRGRDGGTQNPNQFAALVGDASEVELYDWYNGELEVVEESSNQ